LKHHNNYKKNQPREKQNKEVTPVKEKQHPIETPQQLQERKRTAEIIKGEVSAINKGYFIVKNGAKTREIHFASVRLNKREGDREFTSSVLIKFEELMRKLVVGKDFECRKCSTVEFKINEKNIVREYFDVYVGNRNVVIDFIKAYVFNVFEDPDATKRSFDFAELKTYNTKDRKIQKVNFIGGDGIKNVVDTYVDHTFKCFVLNVISPTKYVVYIPEHKCKLNVLIAGVMSDKEKGKVNEEKAISDIKQFFGLNEITISFTNYSKNFFADFKVGSLDLKEFVISKGYAISTRRFNSPKENKEKNEGEEKEKDEGEEKKGEGKKFEGKKFEGKNEKKPRGRAVGFGMKKDIYVVGFDGNKIYYYVNLEDAKVIEEVSTKLSELKKGPIKGKDGDECIVEVEKKFYRGIIIHAKTGGNLVQLKDTGSYIVIGNNKIKATTDEIKQIKNKLQHIELTSVITEKFGDFEFELMLKEMKQFFNKQATLELESENKESGRVTVEGKCLSTFLIEKGYGYLPLGFKDNNVWGVNIIKAQAEAKIQHLNVWKYGELGLD